MTATWTTVGLNLVATAMQTAGIDASVKYVSISTGCGTLGSSLSASNTYTGLSLTGTLPANLSSGQSLTITDGANSQVVTTSGSVLAGASTIPVNAFICLFNFVAGSAGVAPTPQATDVALYNEGIRVALLAAGAGAAAGETLAQGYMDGTQASGVYLAVGYFGGSTATSSAGTGTLMIADVQYWNHTINADSIMYQADAII